MRGASKHIYEVNKLLCEQSRKEYSLDANYKAYNLCAGNETGQSLFKLIVGNKYLIFLQNAIPVFSGKDVMVYPEDVRDGKEKPGLYRLEQSVRQCFLDKTVETEVAFALMFVGALGLRYADPSTLVHSSEEMRPRDEVENHATSSELVEKIQEMGDQELLHKILKGKTYFSY